MGKAWLNEHEETRRFVRRLAAEMPELNELLEQHLVRHDGEILPYVFLGSEVWPWLEEQVSSETEQGRRAARRYMELLEAELARQDAETSNLIGVEFLEWFDGGGYESIRALLPPVLRRKVAGP